MTRLSRSGLSPRLFAIAGIDTAIIVESSPSMKKAQPTTSGMTMRRRGRAAVGKAEPGSLTSRPLRRGAVVPSVRNDRDRVDLDQRVGRGHLGDLDHCRGGQRLPE